MTKKKPYLSPAHKTLFLGVLLIIFASNSYANLVVNGSFEDGNLVPLPANQGTMILVPGQTNLTGWNILPDTIGWLENGHPFRDLLASDGIRFLDLTEFPAGAPFGGVSQDINTIAGGTYDLSFDLGSSTDYGNVPSAITVTAGATSRTFTSAQPTETNEWTTFSLQFAALSATTTISFLGAAGFQYIGLDNISVLGQGPSAVPVPAAVWLFGTALIVLVGFSKRRETV